VEGGWRRLHNEKLHNLYGSANIIKVIKSERMRNAYSILVGTPEGKRSLKSFICRWKIILEWILGN
jgi:hypothetical protein